MIRRLINFVFISLTIVSVSSSQEAFNPGLYTFDCEVQMAVGHVKKLYYVYAGTDEEIQTEEFNVVTEKPSTKWVKKKADRNCLSADPNDCLVWCLMEVPAKMITYQVISDTSSTIDWYELWHRSYDEDEKLNEVSLCKNEITKELLDALKTRLISHGADLKTDKKHKRLKGDLKRELHDFQRDNNLGIGELSYETMKYLFDHRGR